MSAADSPGPFALETDSISKRFGSVQAIEVLKLILDIGDSLAGRLLPFDALTMEFRVVNLRRDPKCPLCGDDPTIDKLIDYEGFCGAPFPAHDGA